MARTLLRWIIPLTALLVLGPIAGLLTASVRAADGGPDATPLVCQTPVRGLICGVAAVALAGATGAVASRLLGARRGLFAAGLVLAWAAWGTGTIDFILRRTAQSTGAGPSGTFATLAVEAAVLGVCATLAAALIFAVARRPRDAAGVRHTAPEELADAGWAYAPERGGPIARALGLLSATLVRIPDGTSERRRGLDDPAGLPTAAYLGILAAMAAAGVVVWFVAVESLKGQTFAAAAAGAIAAAAAGRLAAQHAPAIAFFIAVVVLSIIAPLAAIAVYGSGGGAVQAAYAGNLLPIVRPLPLDYLAGAFVGLPIGLGWVTSLLERHPTPDAASA